MRGLDERRVLAERPDEGLGRGRLERGAARVEDCGLDDEVEAAVRDVDEDGVAVLDEGL